MSTSTEPTTITASSPSVRLDLKLRPAGPSYTNGGWGESTKVYERARTYSFKARAQLVEDILAAAKKVEKGSRMPAMLAAFEAGADKIENHMISAISLSVMDTIDGRFASLTASREL